jgi:hypothetical protein
VNPGDDLDLFPVEDGATPLTPEEELELIPSLATRAQLNEVERLGINTARVWAMRPRAPGAKDRDEPQLGGRVAARTDGRLVGEPFRSAKMSAMIGVTRFGSVPGPAGIRSSP